jgi:hypothetical protein
LVQNANELLTETSDRLRKFWAFAIGTICSPGQLAGFSFESLPLR